MAVDSERRQELDAQLGRQQWGSVASLLDFNADGSGIIDNAQVIRWGGDDWDTNPWRVYLSPWRPKPLMLVDAADESIIADFATIGVAPGMDPNRVVSFSPGVMVWAKVIWGTGSTRNVAWVDWPIAGLLLQVSGRYVEVDILAASYVVSEHSGDADPSKLPDLPATLSDEPGGGDSARSATFTYPMQSLDWNAHDGINFPVVPFARSAYFEWDNTQDGGNIAYATEATIVFVGPNGDTAEGTYVYAFNAGDIGDPREGVPVPPGTSYIRVIPTFSGSPATPLFAVGLSFELDL
jgi:hypothetical protein